MAKRPISLAIIQRELNHIRALAREDPESAHDAECALYKAVLKSICEWSMVEDVQTLATEALKASRIRFRREHA